MLIIIITLEERSQETDLFC